LKHVILFPALFFVLVARGQSGWQQSLRYDIQVQFKPAEKSLDALMKLSYTNHSPDTLRFIWFHVWPNAYRNDLTLYSDQQLENGDTRFYFSSKEQKGYLNRLDFRVNGNPAIIQNHPEHIDIIKLILPKPLLPGDSIQIVTSFHLRLPFNFNGNGYTAHHVEMRNWYPEPAVYDKHGWHPMPFLTQGGAYHEAADYTVEIDAPPAYRIAAGAVADTLSRSHVHNLYRFSLTRANAFAWVADTHYLIREDSLILDSGKLVRLYYFYTTYPLINPDKLIREAKTDLRNLSGWLTPYPHQSISIVQASQMEDQQFTGLVCVGNTPGYSWQYVLRKALSGLWFQTILMTNQRTKPWFSKGFMSYYNQRLNSLLPPVNPFRFPFRNHDLWLRVAENEKTTQPITTAAPEFSPANDSLIAEIKAGLWLAQLRDSVGEQAFDRYMKDYFAAWKFGHPYPEDFKKTFDTASGKNLQSVFDELNSKTSLFPGGGKRIIKPAFRFSARNSEHYNYLGLSPVAGYNHYDDFMLGALIHNINLPENKFEFLFTPLYAFGSKELVGLGRVSYSWHPDNHFSRITLGLNGAHFNTNKATDTSGRVLFEYFSKLVPYIRVDFKPSNPRSSINRWMDFKTYLIREQTFDQYVDYPKDSLFHPNAVTSSFRYVNQLSFNLQDNRALYPYSLRVELQQSELFYRVNLIGNYFMNYPDGGGLKVRFFAAKFGAWNDKNSATLARYEPKLLGVDGEEDYLYEDYFIGRSATYAVDRPSIPNQGYSGQQIMNRDGGLKMRIDDLDYVQGRSSDWVSALNFNTSLPTGIFPFPLPISFYFDVGTYAEAWQNNPPTSKFLFTGGIQLSLFKNVLNIYAPLIYSSDFDAAFGTLSYGRKITFSIDIQNIQYKKIIRKIADRE
jgi:hypothetical protein